MKRLVTLAIAGMLVGTAFPAAAETYREQSQRSFDTAGLNGIRVDNPRGRIELRKSSDNQVHITALKVTRAVDASSARKMAAGITVQIDRSGGTIVVRVRYESNVSVDIDFWELMRGKTVPRSQLTLQVSIPERFPVVVETSSGDVESDQLGGMQTIHSASGDISVTGAAGMLEVSTSSGDVVLDGAARARIETNSGDVEASAVRGALRVRTTNGDVTVHGAGDSLALETSSGDIDVDRAERGVSATTTNGNVSIKGAAGGIRIDTNNGDVNVEIAKAPGRTEITTTSGDIEVELGGQLGCSIEARTTSGEIDVQVPLEVKSVSRQLVSGIIRSGQTPMSLHTVSGDITLSGGQ